LGSIQEEKRLDDTDKFAELLKMANQGNIPAQCTVGLMYYQGKGVAQDFAAAALWLEKAALQGNAGAQYNRGFLYETGKGVERDAVKAAEWYKKAAAQGHARAQNRLSELHKTGDGVTQEVSRAAARNNGKEGVPMPEEKQSLENVSKPFSKWEGTPFTNFSKPYLNFIGKGKFFVIIYTLMAILNLLLPFGIIYKVIDSGLLRWFGAKGVFAFIFSWIVIAFACWIGFQLWWDRKTKAKTFEDSEFTATYIFSEIVQTLGEWIGTLLGIIGAGVGLIAAIMLGDTAGQLFQAIGLSFLPSGIIVVVAGPVIGFVIIILSRFVSEQMRLFVALVNNTRSIADNIKG
jgi:hypothetical protein